MKFTQQVTTTKEEVFRNNYLGAGLLSFFWILFYSMRIQYSNKELNKAKRNASLLGSIQLPILYFVLRKALALFNIPLGSGVSTTVLVVGIVVYIIVLYLVAEKIYPNQI